MSLQWLSVAAFLYTEIGLGLLLCLGFISNARLVIFSFCSGNTPLSRIIAKISSEKTKGIYFPLLSRRALLASLAWLAR